MLTVLEQRFNDCGLELHPTKTKIVYCKDGSRKGTYENTSFDFLGYTFRGRLCKNSKRNSLFINFTPAVSKVSLKAMRAKVKQLKVRSCTHLNLIEIARWLNPTLSGWLNYYGKYTRSAMYGVWRHVNKTLIRWARRKYKSLRHHKTKASVLLEGIAKQYPNLFVHWRYGMKGAFA
jgi:hypothetical protein